MRRTMAESRREKAFSLCAGRVKECRKKIETVSGRDGEERQKGKA